MRTCEGVGNLGGIGYTGFGDVGVVMVTGWVEGGWKIGGR